MNYENYLRSYHLPAGNSYSANIQRKVSDALKGVMKTLIAIYQVHLKWFWIGDCKFHPSCSCYAMDCVSKHSPTKALYLIFLRLIKCNPFSQGGYDPGEN